ncbi:helix-turn-helix domain-containing protein [Sphingomonas guangdongensis]|nr:helix-turn-helix transcriptional regulator [Sphingomonas guangdongensis]
MGEIVRHPEDEPSRANSPDPSQLTDRQRDCLQLVGRGMSSKEIAGELGISHHTVDLHLKRAIRILGATSRRDAARRASELPVASNQHLATQAGAVVGPAEIMASPVSAAEPGHSALRVPFLRQGRQRNDLSPASRIGWIAVLAMAMLIAAANFLNGLGALYKLAD